jgi:hypothetical protein
MFKKHRRGLRNLREMRGLSPRDAMAILFSAMSSASIRDRRFILLKDFLAFFPWPSSRGLERPQTLQIMSG